MQLFVIINNVGIKIKELNDKEICDKGFIWNPSNCERKCDENCDIGEYLDYKNCKCRKKLVEPIVDECTETIVEVKLANTTVQSESSYYKCSSCKVYIVFMMVVFTIFT